MKQMTDSGLADFRWQGLYKLGGFAALMIGGLLLGEIAVYALLPSPTTALEHFELFRANWLAGLLSLDLLGMISYLLFVPMILALYVALRRTGEAVMVVATALFFVGIADFFAGAAGIAAVVLEHIMATDVLFVAISLYFAAIVFLSIWVVLAGRRLYQLRTVGDRARA